MNKEVGNSRFTNCTVPSCKQRKPCFETDTSLGNSDPERSDSWATGMLPCVGFLEMNGRCSREVSQWFSILLDFAEKISVWHQPYLGLGLDIVEFQKSLIVSPSSCNLELGCFDFAISFLHSVVCFPLVPIHTENSLGQGADFCILCSVKHCTMGFSSHVKQRTHVIKNMSVFFEQHDLISQKNGVSACICL